MKRIETLERTRSEKGTQSLRQYSDRHDPLLMKAIELYQSKYKSKFGRSPSRSKLFATALLEQNDDVRAIYEQLKEKVKNESNKTTTDSQPSDQGPRTATPEQL